MTIQLTPDEEQLIRTGIETGAFENAEDVIHRALESFAAQEEWLRSNRDAIAQRIDQGLAELDRGEGLDEAAARARMEQHKAEWRASRR